MIKVVVEYSEFGDANTTNWCFDVEFSKLDRDGYHRETVRIYDDLYFDHNLPCDTIDRTFGEQVGGIYSCC